jgi:hypothetical protein
MSGSADIPLRFELSQFDEGDTERRLLQDKSEDLTGESLTSAHLDGALNVDSGFA